MAITLPERTRSVRRRPRPGDGSPRGDRTGPRVAASLLGGAASAAVLTLGVLAGAAEHVVTGSALLAFAAGWGLLAVLTERTARPQRWALVPAGWLAVPGAGVLTLGAGNDTLEAAGWVWPAGLLALAGWIAVRSGRSLPVRSRRWLVFPVCALMALAAVGGGTETVLESAASAAPSAGGSYDIGGHRLYLRCEGSGSPTVLLSNGFGERSPSWAWIVPAVAEHTRVCVYDRAGQGWSGPAGAQDGVALATDLHTLVRVARVPGPYLLAGHSVGGIYGMVFAARYPDETAGLVLLDSSTPDQFALPDYPGAYAMGRRMYGVLPSLSRLGAARIFLGSGFGGLPADARDDERAFAADPGNLRAERDEWLQLPTAFGQAAALRDLGTRPLVVLTAGHGAQTGWFAAQDRLAALSSNAAHRTLMAASHESLVQDRRFAGYASQAIRDVVTAVRTGRHVTP